MLYVPPFPTRRSSDLSAGEGDVEALVHQALGVQALGGAEALEERHRAALEHAGAHAPQDVLRRARSEEHTSELQSPCNLVCRLLLETKKNWSTTKKTH